MDGKIDPTFVVGSGFDDFVQALVLQPNGKVIVGGNFTTYNGVGCPRGLVRLNSDGTLDDTFNGGGSDGFNLGTVTSLALQPDGKVIVGGDFTQYNGNNCPGKLVRIDTEGALDDTFNGGGFGFNYGVYALALQPDGKIIVGGNFTTYNGVSAKYLVRIDTNGTLDNSFDSGGGFDGVVSALALQPNDGKVIVGGNFNYAGGPAKLVRINPDGALDNSFNGGGTGFNTEVFALALQSDGKVIVGGNFTQYNGNDCPDKLVRIDTEGALDLTFNGGGDGFDAGVLALALQSDGKVIAGGHFTQYNGNDCPDKLVRIDTEGALDPTFNDIGAGFDSFVLDLIIQPNGRIIVGGYFTAYSDGTAHLSSKIIRLKGHFSLKVNNFQGENFSIGRSVKILSAKVNNTFKIPIANAPAQEPGSISMDLQGTVLKIRKPGGDVGSINIV